MSNNSHIYLFEDFELDEEEEKLFRNREQVPLQPKAVQILLLLVANAGRIVKNEEILKKVWQGEIVEESGINIRINAIRKALGQKKDSIFIRTESKGFKFVKPLTQIEKLPPTLITKGANDQKNVDFQTKEDRSLSSPDLKSPNIESPASDKNIILGAALGIICALIFILVGANFGTCDSDCFPQNIFIFLTATTYGVLVGIGVLLECAYEFDRYGWKAAKITLAIVLINFGAAYAGLTAAESLLSKGTGYAFGLGLCFFISGAILSCLLARFVLPNRAITAAKFPTQPALTAFCKNVFLYFLPLYSIFCLLVFCLIYGDFELANNIISPIGFSVLLLLLVAFSYISTNYLSDNLLTARDGERYKYHGLFSSLLLFRAIFCFGMPLISIVWYFIQVLNQLDSGK